MRLLLLAWVVQWLLIVALGALVIGECKAAALPLQLPANLVANGSGIVTSGAMSFPAASGLTTQVAGRLVTVPASMRVAANAASIATAAVRLNPSVLVVGAVAAWLIPYGIEYLNGKLVKKDPNNTNYDPAQSGWAINTSAVGNPCSVATFSCTLATAQAWVKGRSDIGCGGPGYTFGILRKANETLFYQQCYLADGRGPFDITAYPMVRNAGSPAQVLYNAPSEADWNTVNANPLPDAAASELSSKSVAIPVQVVPSPGTQTVPLSDPYTDPVTGKRYRDIARITPGSTNPRIGDIQVTREELDSATDTPATQPDGTKKPEEENKDECLQHPDRVSCKDWGDTPPLPDLQASTKTITIAPDTGWGADTAACPADLTTTTRNGGKVLTFSWKPVCDSVDMFRPVVIGMAWLTAVLIAMAITRRGD